MRKRYIPRLIILTFACFLHSFAWAQEPAKQATIKVEGEVTHPMQLSSTDLAKMKRVEVHATDYYFLCRNWIPLFPAGSLSWPTRPMAARYPPSLLLPSRLSFIGWIRPLCR